MENEMRNDIDRMINFRKLLKENETKDSETVNTDGPMNLISTVNDYDFYSARDINGKEFYNVVPKGSSKPTGGYYNSDYIAKVKGVANIF